MAKITKNKRYIRLEEKFFCKISHPKIYVHFQSLSEILSENVRNFQIFRPKILCPKIKCPKFLGPKFVEVKVCHEIQKLVSPGHKTSSDTKILFQLFSYSGSVTLAFYE